MQGRELEEVAAVQGKLADLLAGDEAGDVGAPVVDTDTAGVSTFTVSVTLPVVSWTSSDLLSATFRRSCSGTPP